MQILTEQELSERLSSIENYLMRELPKAALAVSPSEPAFCLFLQYVDFSACDEFRPLIGWGLSRLRSMLVERHGGEAWQYVWNPSELDNIERLRTFPVGDDSFHRLCRECYEHFFDSIGDQVPGDDDEERAILLPFRQLIHRVSLHYNAFDWPSVCSVTSDFVVVPMDWQGPSTFYDMEAGIPCDRLIRLREQNLFRFLSDF